ncbi:MAG: hypothetical protein WC365_08230 [Candidatus Babeliales bacterium]|jgi:hypothetical protein
MKTIKHSGIPTDEQIREYLGTIGQSVNKAFLLGFASGWNARNNGFNPSQGASSSTKSLQDPASTAGSALDKHCAHINKIKQLIEETRQHDYKE